MDLANSLPDTVWISQLSLSSDQVSLSGFTSLEVPNLIQQIQALPWATHAKLAGPAAIDSYSGQTRFDVVIPQESEPAQR